MKKYISTSVFSDGPNGGNPCLVIMDSDGLAAEKMIRASGVYGFEAVGISRSNLPGVPYRFRFFTPQAELSSCGHATIAAAAVLAESGSLAGRAFQAETADGILNLRWDRTDQGTLVSVDQPHPRGLHLISDRETDGIIQALGTDHQALSSDIPCCAAATSRYKLIVPLNSIRALHEMKPDYPMLWKLCDIYGVSGFYPYAEEQTEEGCIRYHARQFPNHSGYPEDPATGVAASALLSYLAVYWREHLLDAGEIEIIQGEAMGRPSRLLVRYSLKGNALAAIQLSGMAEIYSSTDSLQHFNPLTDR